MIWLIRFCEGVLALAVIGFSVFLAGAVLLLFYQFPLALVPLALAIPVGLMVERFWDG